MIDYVALTILLLLSFQFLQFNCISLLPLPLLIKNKRRLIFLLSNHFLYIVYI